VPLPARPHVLGIDDGPFRKHHDAATPVVGVMSEGASRVEAVAVTSFPIDGDDVTGFLVEWIGALPFRASLQAVALCGVTLAGLAVVDVPALADGIGLPVIVASRKDPARSRVAQALRAAGLSERIATLERAPAAVRVADGLHLAFAGTREAEARALLEAVRDKSALPEPVRVAHLVAAAIVRGSSRGRA
jgi:endonuclease V-like protein UPF0215 family